MNDAELGSAVHTVKVWRERRLAKNKGADTAAIEAHIRAMWPDLSNTDVAAIMIKGNF